MAAGDPNRRLLLFRPAPRPVEAEESLAALLARREAVRSTRTGPAQEPSPDLFRTERPVTMTLPGAETTIAAAREPDAAPSEAERPKADTPASTTSRLLEAKRRAQRRK